MKAVFRSSETNFGKCKRIFDSTALKMKFSIKDFFSKCDQIRRKLRIWSHLLKKSLMKNLIFCAVYIKNFVLLQNFFLLVDTILKIKCQPVLFDFFNS